MLRKPTQPPSNTAGIEQGPTTPTRRSFPQVAQMSPPAGHLLLAQVLLGPWPWASPNRGSSCSAALLRLPARRSLRAAAPRTWRTAPAAAGARLLGHCCSWLLGDTGPRLRAQRSARLRPGSSRSAARGTHCPALRKRSVGKELGRPPLPESTALRQDRRENPPLPSSCRRAQVQTVNQQACGLSFSPADWFWIHELGDATAFSPGQGWPESWDDLTNLHFLSGLHDAADLQGPHPVCTRMSTLPSQNLSWPFKISLSAFLSSLCHSSQWPRPPFPFFVFRPLLQSAVKAIGPLHLALYSFKNIY